MDHIDDLDRLERVIAVASSPHRVVFNCTCDQGDQGEHRHDWPGSIALDPATLQALVAELRAAREFRDEVHSALQPGRWRGFDGPDGVSKDEVIADVAAVLERNDKAVSP
jgi:hypothetical protein